MACHKAQRQRQQEQPVLSPGCRTCRTCRTLSDTVGPLSDADCRTAVGLTVGLSGTVGPLRVRQHDRALSDTVRLLSDYCRTLSDAVGRCRTLSDAVRLSDCRTVGLLSGTTVGLSRTVGILFIIYQILTLHYILYGAAIAHTVALGMTVPAVWLRWCSGARLCFGALRLLLYSCSNTLAQQGTRGVL